ncbi:MAG TPA: hypothetical protein DEG09_03535 [Marinilabiliaceae bacterium]|nr:hypothetical protein [Marinilabiliaceae bacterium]HBX87670.1 hypothetical protein [Marinilabiliaceae bacterium]
MKRFNYKTMIIRDKLKYLCVIIGLALMISARVNAQQINETLSTSYLYPATRTVSVQINNKYGHVKVNTWAKDSVKVEITQTYTHTSIENINKLKSSINILRYNASGTIRFETSFEQSGGRFFRNVREATNMFGSESNTRIDYSITLPARSNINIINKYGDVILPTLSGRVTVDLSNGNFQAQRLSGHSELNLAFGNALINELNNGVLGLNFVELSLNRANSLTVNGSSSKIDIKSITDLVLDSRRDRVIIEKAGKIAGTTYFTSANFGELANRCELDMTYGELSGLKLLDSTTECIIVARTCNLNIEMMQPSAYSLLLKKSGASLKFPESLTPAPVRAGEEGLSRYYFRSNIAESKLKINIQNGNFKIIHQ